jgi:hypothetical protein
VFFAAEAVAKVIAEVAAEVVAKVIALAVAIRADYFRVCSALFRAINQ